MELKKQIEYYKTKEGEEPVKKWLHSLDKTVRSRIDSRLTRVTNNNYGQIRIIKGQKDVIQELKFSFGPGYRIYFYEDGLKIILLLSAGDKKTQESDIHQARNRLNDYLKRKNQGEYILWESYQVMSKI